MFGMHAGMVMFEIHAGNVFDYNLYMQNDVFCEVFSDFSTKQ